MLHDCETLSRAASAAIAEVPEKLTKRGQGEGVGRGWLLVPRCVTIDANNKVVKGRNRINRVASEFVFHTVHPDTDTPLLEEREEPSLHLSSTSKISLMETRVTLEIPVLVLSKSFQEMVQHFAEISRTQCLLVFWIGFPLMCHEGTLTTMCFSTGRKSGRLFVEMSLMTVATTERKLVRDYNKKRFYMNWT